MKRRERDLIALFNSLWYRDFPVTPKHEELGRRAVWTTHIASIVKQCADLMGFFTCFESGGRTDAVIQTADRKTWAKVEWEWAQPRLEQVNEIQKLADAANDAELLVFIGYSREEHHLENLERIAFQWKDVATPLLVFLVQFQFHKGRRHFTYLRTYYVRNGKWRLLRKQPALPWNVAGTRWQFIAGQSSIPPMGPPIQDDVEALEGEC